MPALLIVVVTVLLGTQLGREICRQDLSLVIRGWRKFMEWTPKSCLVLFYSMAYRQTGVLRAFGRVVSVDDARYSNMLIQ